MGIWGETHAQKVTKEQARIKKAHDQREAAKHAERHRIARTKGRADLWSSENRGLTSKKWSWW